MFLLGDIKLRMVQRKKWNPEGMNTAIESIRNKEMGSYKASRIFVICLPPHTSHKTQPYDKVFMGPPKTFYWQEIEKWLRSNPGRLSPSTKLGSYSENTSSLQQARQRLMAAGRQAFPFNTHFFRSCAKYFRWVHTLYARVEEILLASLVRDKHCVVLCLYPL
jgi:hypothetical protein